MLKITDQSLISFCALAFAAAFLLVNTQCKKDPLDDLDCGVDIFSFTSEITSMYPGTELTGPIVLRENLEDIGEAEIRQMIGIYLSTDALYTDSDREIVYTRGPLTVSEENADESTLEWNLVMPFDIEPGNYYLLARIQNQTWVCGTNGDDSVWVLPETASLPITILE